MKILLVEHNAEMRRLVRSMIAEVTDEIHESTGGKEVVGLYQSVRPDWVVIDIFRKPENGLTVANSIIRADPEANVVFISDYTDERTRQWATGTGGRAFFGKGDLLSLVEFLKNEKASLR